MMNRFFATLCVALALFPLSGCYEVEETIVNIRVVRMEGEEEVPMDDCLVQIYYSGTTGQLQFNGPDPSDIMGRTTQEGFATFNFSEYYVAGQAGLAVLDVEACRGRYYGTGLIKINEMQTNETTIVVETLAPGISDCWEDD